MTVELPEGIYFGKSSEMMDQVPNNSVQTVITSPPYYDLKDYGHKDQIGAEDSSYKEFHKRLSTVWGECFEKLRHDGTIWIVADTRMDNNGNLTLLPYDIIEHAEQTGFHHVDTIVWYKPTSLGGMNPKILANKKEYVLLLSKSDDPKFNQKIKLDNNVEDPAISDDGRLGNLWRFPVKRGSIGKNNLHKAPFPLLLVKRMIKLSTDSGDAVLDPFLGSGTTAFAALELERDIFGYEINPEFESIVRERLESLLD